MATAQFAPPMGASTNMFKSDLDMDSFFDFNQGANSFASRPVSRASVRPSSSKPILQQQQQPQQDEREDRQFAGPSHEYDRFKQQTGIPVGDLSHLNQPMPGYHQQQQHQQQMYGGFNSGIDEMHMQTSYANEADADMHNDFVPGMFYNPNERQAQDFVDPNSIDANDEPSHVRLWPGMHQQQAQRAAMVKAQQTKGKGAVKAHDNDPHTEESISRLLHQMRQNSTVPSIPEDEMSSSFLAGLGRSRKDEEDMDEDERLLASEEGKKLSSKERRQLRNKVSARAFRSRRKEYITQLEGEVARATQESNVLKSHNNELADENARYKGLIQFLLRQPAFAPVLDDISKDPNFTAFAQQAQQHAQQAQHMGMMQEPAVDLSMLNINNNGFAMPPPPQQMGFNYQ